MIRVSLLVICASILATYASAQILPVQSEDSLLWGSYRPNLYLGIRPQIPNSLILGLMWANVDERTDSLRNLRHTCEQNEGMASYGWVAYDPRLGGVQIINDTKNHVDLITSFAKPSLNDSNEDWGLRIKVVPRTNAGRRQKTIVVFYIGNEDSTSDVSCTKNENSEAYHGFAVCESSSAKFGQFKLYFTHQQHEDEASQKLSIKSLNVERDKIWQAKEIFMDHTQATVSAFDKIDYMPQKGNLHFVQNTFENDFQFDILYSSSRDTNTLRSDSLTSMIETATSEFQKHFHSSYAAQSPFLDDSHSKFSQYLLSNLMGGIGYFHGTSKVDVSYSLEYAGTEQYLKSRVIPEQHLKTIKEQGPFKLLSAVPSRPFFPRGFLWDEGFHLLVIMDYDMDLALTILSSWFDLMDDNGWIAREQILGPEARSKVPAKFQTQYPDYANPPTLFLVVEEFIARLNGGRKYAGVTSTHLKDYETAKAFVTAIYPKLNKLYDWFKRTQSGNLSCYNTSDQEYSQGYRWRGHIAEHILTSGLDDYPRAQPPRPEELHLDAICWVAIMTRVLQKTSTFLGQHQDHTKFTKTRIEIIQSIEEIHWSDTEQAYCDVTITNNKIPVKVCHKGYISLFPFIAGLINTTHPHLEAILNFVQDPNHLWTPYGLRSLSKKDQFYGQGENYWRGPIWININFMVLQTLLDLASQPESPNQTRTRTRIKRIYSQLRINLVNTVYKSWKETGFAWEQYNPDTGKGQRTQHFTGWTSLIVKVTAMPQLEVDNEFDGEFDGDGRGPELGYWFSGPGWDSWRLVLVMMVVIMVLIVGLLRRVFWRGRRRRVVE